MGTPTLIGAAAPRAAYTARYLHYGEHPNTLVPLLRRIWIETFTRDTAALVAALLARDWSSLAVEPRRRSHDRQRPVAGVGYPSPAVTASCAMVSSAKSSTDSWNGCT